MSAPDLFGAAAPSPAPPSRRVVAHTCRRVELRSDVLGIKIDPGQPVVADVFVHPCGLCGAEPAPFGSNVSILKALATRDGKHAGTWLCGPCHWWRT